MSLETTNAFENMIEMNILNIAYNPLSNYIQDNYSRLDLTYRTRIVENVEQATLLDFRPVRVIDINQSDDNIMFQVIIDTEIEIEETLHHDREVDCVNKWFLISFSAKIDDIKGSFTVESIRPY